ncbi:aldolase/citrate lyase family protein [Neptunomonas qingdaonensis]|uniref:HpcH/HpaI aldolase/citrate lyase family protein n=1 Tax=Neptunomonas qingdaonensis TaxID=1045558 RepID=A0A1I2N491_9GAMM|nr:aldolase/citrate lyase family protein [Neptunomonas qingdaonensis]SFF96211.1 HpcH/HpaI aldolase/citrate lyase family protein [Neptunomonas qingdaonensis]
MIKFILITNDLDLAVFAEACGVERIFVDLERLGKKERQGHLDTLISQHSIGDAKKIKKKLKTAKLIVRLNPLNTESLAEVDAAIEAGADYIMLPMFRKAEEVKSFLSLVNGRAGVIPLVETKGAADSLSEIVTLPGVSEIYIGLNDLHLDMGLSFMFEPLANGLLDSMASTIKAAGKSFGFGGIARFGEGLIPGEMVLAEHVRLGSESVILSRTFHRKSEGMSTFKVNLDLKKELFKLREEEVRLTKAPVSEYQKIHKELQDGVQQIVAGKGNK